VQCIPNLGIERAGAIHQDLVPVEQEAMPAVVDDLAVLHWLPSPVQISTQRLSPMPIKLKIDNRMPSSRFRL
jgi:hypothetical protein